MEDTKVMTVEEMIRLSFKDKDKNVVNFNLIGTILHLFARQLQVLKRKVEVKLDTPYNADVFTSNIIITEVKLHASTSHKKDESIPKLAKTQPPVVRYEQRIKESQASQKPSIKALSETTRARKFSEDIFSRRPDDTDDMFLYFSPRFSEGKHLTSRSSLDDSMGISKSKPGDKCGELYVPVEMEQVEHTVENKQSQAKSLDTLLYKVDTNTRGKRRVAVATADNILSVLKNPNPQIIIKEITHTTDTETDEKLKKIVILKKVRKRIKPKPLKTLPSEASESFQTADVDKYRLSTEPYLGEDFVPIDLTKPDIDEEIIKRQSIFKSGRETFSAEDEIEADGSELADDSILQGTLTEHTNVDDNIYLGKGRKHLNKHKLRKEKKVPGKYGDLDASDISGHDTFEKGEESKGKDSDLDTSKNSDEEMSGKGKKGVDANKVKLGKDTKGKGIDKANLEKSKRGQSIQSDGDELVSREKDDEQNESKDGVEYKLDRGITRAAKDGEHDADFDSDKDIFDESIQERGEDDEFGRNQDGEERKSKKYRRKYGDQYPSEDGDDDNLGKSQKSESKGTAMDTSHDDSKDTFSKDKIGKSKRGHLGRSKDSEKAEFGKGKKGKGKYDDLDRRKGTDEHKDIKRKQGKGKADNRDESEEDDDNKLGKSSTEDNDKYIEGKRKIREGKDDVTDKSNYDDVDESGKKGISKDQEGKIKKLKGKDDERDTSGDEDVDKLDKKDSDKDHEGKRKKLKGRDDDGDTSGDGDVEKLGKKDTDKDQEGERKKRKGKNDTSGTSDDEDVDKLGKKDSDKDQDGKRKKHKRKDDDRDTSDDEGFDTLSKKDSDEDKDGKRKKGKGKYDDKDRSNDDNDYKLGKSKKYSDKDRERKKKKGEGQDDEIDTSEDDVDGKFGKKKKTTVKDGEFDISEDDDNDIFGKSIKDRGSINGDLYKDKYSDSYIVYRLPSIR